MQSYKIHYVYNDEPNRLRLINLRAKNEEKAKLYFRAIFNKTKSTLIKVGELEEKNND